ncbi:MAG: serine hydrolase domain-containing protein [Thermoanaerobaculia bacterium]
MNKKLVLVVVVLFSALFTAPARAQVEVETRPKQKVASQAPAVLDARITRLLSVLNSGDEAGIRQFVVESFSAEALKRRPVEPRVARLKDLAADGPYELLRPLAAGPDGPRALIRSKKSRETQELMLELDPHGIVSVQLEAAGPESETEADGGPKASDQEAAAATEAHVARLAASQAFSGVVLMARKGKVFFEKAYGMANEDFDVPNRLDTKFNIGSINKVFTQILVAQLAQEKKLDLDDPIAKILTELRIPSAGTITVRHLVTMSSGLGDIFGEKYQATSKENLRKLSDFVPLFADQPLLFAPGARKEYSNAGYVVLGLIVEKLTGLDYAEAVSQHVCRIAGMTDTGVYEQDAVTKNRATGYTRRVGPGRRSNIYTLPARASSAGGGYSTAHDLLRLDAALRADKLVNHEWTGWVLGDKDAKPAAQSVPGPHRGGFGFAGGSPGVNGVVEMNLTGGTTIIVLSNLDPPSAESVARRLRSWLPKD